jgi:tripartite-type tricarboxylate transporter receptor subunit TctC
MKLHRRQFLKSAALGLGTAALAMPAVSRFAWAEAYPARPVRIVVGFGPGGAADILARLIGQWLSQQLGQPFIIENRPGASANIATEAVVRAPADGYTLLLTHHGNAINQSLYDRLNFDFVRDIAPVGAIAVFAGVMEVNPSFPARTVPEFIAYAKANPGKFTMATAGTGTIPQMWGELFKMAAGVDLISVPYRGGSGPALSDLIGGQVDVTFDPIPGSIEFIRSGKLRALGVTSAKRVEQLPEVPTIGEFVRDYDAIGWNGIGAPKKTPPEVIEKLNRAIAAALADPKLKERIAELGATALVTSPAQFAALIAKDVEKWANVIRIANIKAD